MTHAWGVYLATLVLALMIGIGATFSDSPDDRLLGPRLLIVAAIAILLALVARHHLRAGCVVLIAAQAIVWFLQVRSGLGTPAIIGLINGLLIAGWATAGYLFNARRT